MVPLRLIVDRQDYIKRINNILSDQRKLTIIYLKDDSFFNFAVDEEKHVDNALKKNLLSLTVWQKNPGNR